MATRIQSYPDVVTDARGTRFHAHVEGVQEPDGTWHAWLLFEPETGAGPTLRTDRETSQSEREDLEYWAAGLEPVYLEGALRRARPAEGPGRRGA